jgi:hypothetical protein
MAPTFELPEYAHKTPTSMIFTQVIPMPKSIAETNNAVRESLYIVTTNIMAKIPQLIAITL